MKELAVPESSRTATTANWPSALVDQVRHHGKTLVIHAFFRRMVEVKLDEFVFGPAHHNVVVAIQINLNGVAIVQDGAVAGCKLK